MTQVDPTPSGLTWEEADGRNDPAQRYALYRLCPCEGCSGTGKVSAGAERCSQCRGEGRTRELVATCASAEAVGVSLVTLAAEGEFEDCPIGLLDRQPEGKETGTWLIRPWLPSARNVSDAARTLRYTQTKGKEQDDAQRS